MLSELAGHDSVASEATWGDEQPTQFEPVSVRPFFTNRDLYRTRGNRQGRRVTPLIVRRISATPRPRAARSRVAQRSRSPGRLADEPHLEPWDDGFLAASARMHAHVLRRAAVARYA